MAGEEPAGAAIEEGGVLEWVIKGDLAGQGGEVTVADFDLDGGGGEPVVGEFLGEFGGLFAQTLAEGGAVGGVAEERIFAADGFDFIGEVERAVVLAVGHAIEFVAPGSDEGAEIARGGLQIGDGFEAGFV